MSFQDLYFNLIGEVPGLPAPLAKTMVNNALGFIYDSQLWSWQLKESNWLTPGLLFGSGNVSSGTITATSYSDQIVGDATAAALWVAYASMPLLTQFQIRVPSYSLYNIIAFDGVNTFTLDRPWMEPDGAGLSYMIYQAYFAAPLADFKRFFAVRDTINGSPLDYWSMTQKDLALIDPQRTNYNQPGYVIPYEVDARTGSATLGYMLYELWPHPLSERPYTFNYLRRGPTLTANSDTISYPLTEEMVSWRAKEVAYLWAEAQKGQEVKRGSGADWRFLAGAAKAEYERVAKLIRDRDRDLCDGLYWSRFVLNEARGSTGSPFATANSGLSVGRF